MQLDAGQDYEGGKTGTRPATPGVVHNLNGQRLGRKGRQTRENILTAAEKLVRETDNLQISLSAVAREADMGMTALYKYFGDLTEVLLAVLERVMAEADDAYLAQLRRRWNDEDLAEECQTFINAFYAFWNKHTNLLHLRNNFADQRDQQMLAFRAKAAKVIIQLIVSQMDGDPNGRGQATHSMASALYMGIERAASVLTNHDLPNNLPGLFRPNAPLILGAEARLLEFGIREMRAENC